MSLGAVFAAFACHAVACNALTGASDLAVCEGATCASEPGALPDGGPNGDGSVSDGSTLPAACVDGQKACEGRTAARCVGTSWSRTPCAEACVDGACLAWPSCRNAAGAGCAATRSCCETAPVPAGTFNRRSSPQTPATVSAFSLDSFEVTVGRFRSFVAAGGGTKLSPPPAGAGAHPKIAGSGWQTGWISLLPETTEALTTLLATGTWTPSAGAAEHKPISSVPWLVAFAFCAADGARLPTYAEWNYAAAGGSEQRVYPWSSPPTSTTVSTANAAYQCAFALPAQSCPPSVCSAGGASPCVATQCLIAGGTCTSSPCTGCEVSVDVAPVGSFASGLGRFGHFDLGGNVAEHVLDALDRKTNKDDLPNPCVDCASLLPPPPVVGGAGEAATFVLGGDWNTLSPSLRTDDFTTVRITAQTSRIGFRCARD